MPDINVTLNGRRPLTIAVQIDGHGTLRNINGLMHGIAHALRGDRPSGCRRCNPHGNPPPAPHTHRHHTKTRKRNRRR